MASNLKRRATPESLEDAARRIGEMYRATQRVSAVINDHYQSLMYQGGAVQRGLGLQEGKSGEDIRLVHGWFSAGVEAAYKAIQDRSDVPEDVKWGLASYAGLVHGLKIKGA